MKSRVTSNKPIRIDWPRCRCGRRGITANYVRVIACLRPNFIMLGRTASAAALLPSNVMRKHLGQGAAIPHHLWLQKISSRSIWSRQCCHLKTLSSS